MASNSAGNLDREDKEKDQRASSQGSATELENVGSVKHAGSSNHNSNGQQRVNASAKLANPLSGLDLDQLAKLGESYAHKAGLTSEDELRAFRIGAMIAGNENRHHDIPGLTEAERNAIDREVTHKWSNPSMLYWVVVSRSRVTL